MRRALPAFVKISVGGSKTVRGYPWMRVAPFVGGLIIVPAVFTAVYLFFVRTHIGQVIDERAYTGAAVWQQGIAPFALRYLDVVPVLSVILGLVTALIVTAIRRNWTVLIVGTGVALAATVSTQILKSAVLGREHLGVGGYLENSLPSGHTTVAASAALLVFLVSSRRLRPVVAVLGAAFAIVAGTSTLVNQWHRPSDVIAALLVVAFWGCIAGMVLAQLPSVHATDGPHRRSPAVPWLAIACVAVSALAFAASYFYAVTGKSHLFIAYAGAIAAIVSAGLLLAVAANWAFFRLR